MYLEIAKCYMTISQSGLADVLISVDAPRLCMFRWFTIELANKIMMNVVY